MIIHLQAVKAQEEFKLSLCWTLISSASTMCSMLGYHRKSTLDGDQFAVAETKRHAFWKLYTMDKNLSLNLGRTSNFPDYDIDAELFTPSTNLKQRPWDLMALATIKFAKVQGQVYNRLYSASAPRAYFEERSRAIDELSTELSCVHNELIAVCVL